MDTVDKKLIDHIIRWLDHNIVNGESIGVEVIEVIEDNNVETSLPEKHTKK